LLCNATSIDAGAAREVWAAVMPRAARGVLMKLLVTTEMQNTEAALLRRSMEEPVHSEL
jgi:hypothetical protein